MLHIKYQILLDGFQSIYTKYHLIGHWFMYRPTAYIIHSTLKWPIVKSEKLKIEYFRFDIWTLYLIE